MNECLSMKYSVKCFPSILCSKDFIKMISLLKEIFPDNKESLEKKFCEEESYDDEGDYLQKWYPLRAIG